MSLRLRAIGGSAVCALVVSSAVLAPSAGAVRGDVAPPGPLFGIDAIASNDVWAVGVQPIPNDPDDARTLIEHWDGKRWAVVRSPGSAALRAVSAASADDVWAVGSATPQFDDDSQLIVEHWNGRTWKVVDAPKPSIDNFLTGVAAVASDDVWAVGAQSDNGLSANRSLIEHWNGSTWQEVATPDPVGFDTLSDVTAISSNDVWAVGRSNLNGTFGTFTMHFDGTSWTVVPSPSVGGVANQLVGVSGASSNDVWAVGWYDAGQPYVGKTLTEHWDGTAWTVVSSPNRGSADHLFDVSAFASNQVWTVGNYNQDAFKVKSFTLHRTSGAWRVVTAPDTHSLQDVVAISSNDVWAVGSHVLHWDGTGWRVVPA